MHWDISPYESCTFPSVEKWTLPLGYKVPDSSGGLAGGSFLSLGGGFEVRRTPSSAV